MLTGDGKPPAPRRRSSQRPGGARLRCLRLGGAGARVARTAGEARLRRERAGPGGERQRERAHGPVREAIDDANDVLLDPFAGIVDSESPWVTRGVPSLLALAVFGFGLGMLANFRPKRSSGGDWRAS